MQQSRREFVKLSVTLSGGLIFKFDAMAAITDFEKQNRPFAPNIYLQIDSDNLVTFRLLKQEMGQGVDTGLPMILADELGADWKTLRVELVKFDSSLPNSHEPFGLMETGGSTSTMESWDTLRRAGASVRETLILAAAQRWKVDPRECRTADSKVHHDESGRSATFGSLAAAALSIDPPSAPRLKNPHEFTLIGRPLHSRKNLSVVLGQASYGIDVRVPGMLYAAIARSPVVGGRVVKFDDSQARAVAGVVAVVKVDGKQGDRPHWRFEEGVAVVAESTWAAFSGRRVLRITWDDGERKKLSTARAKEQFTQAASTDLRMGLRVGDIDTAFADATKVIEATYETPYLPHNMMEPLNAVADVKKDACEIWAGCQSPQYTSHYLAELLGIPLQNIRLHPQSSGGGFGRRFMSDYVAEAAVISQRVDRPVMSVWSREDEIRHGRYHPMRHDHFRVAIDARGAWSALDYVGITSFFRPASVSPLYPVPHIRERHRQMEPIVNVGPWRSVSAHPMVFGQESIVDEIAAAVSADPFDYRVRLLNRTAELSSDGPNSEALLKRYAQLRPRLLRVLTHLRQRSRWDERQSAKRHCGLAISDFHGSSVCGQVAEVKATDQGLVVSKVTCVLECGTIVNPQLVRAQIEGSILWGLTAVLYGGITVRDGSVVESNFHDAPVLRMSEVPEIDILLLDSDLPPEKVGEAAVPPLAPAVANAVFAAIGQRVRSFPFHGFATRRRLAEQESVPERRSHDARF
jgi:isoquinoline 1-oxidoreductase subunit beta